MTDKENLGSCLAVNLMMLADMIDRHVKPLIESGHGSSNPNSYTLLEPTLRLCASQMEQLIKSDGKNKLPPHLEHVRQGLNDILEKQEAKAND